MMEQSKVIQEAQKTDAVIASYQLGDSIGALVSKAFAQRMAQEGLRPDFSEKNAGRVADLYRTTATEVIGHYGMQQREAQKTYDQASKRSDATPQERAIQGDAYRA